MRGRKRRCGSAPAPSEWAVARSFLRSRACADSEACPVSWLCSCDFSLVGLLAQECRDRSEEYTSELQSLAYLVCRLLIEKKKTTSELQSLAYLVCRLLVEKKKGGR